MAIALLRTGHSGCFLPKMIPPFTVELRTKSNGNPTSAPTTAPTASPTNAPTSAPSASPIADELKDEIEHLRHWESVLRKHFISYLKGETDLEEFKVCYSDSVTFNLADGPGSAMNIHEYHIVTNTYIELLTNYSNKNSSAEFIDDHTIEVKYIQITSGQFGFMRGVFPWITALSDVDGNDGEIGWEAWQTVKIRTNDDGLIQEFTIVSPQFVRQILGAILALYVTTRGPIIQDVESAETLTIFGYNAIVVIMLALISVMTTLVGLCVYLSMRYCARRGSEPVVYRKVEIVTDTEMDQ